MEDVIAVYHLPYDPDYPQVCMDESCKQLIGEVHEAIACAPGRPKRMDAEYVRNGVVQIFLEVEPLTGKRHVEATEHRTRKDWAWWIKGMLDERYPNAVKVRFGFVNSIWPLLILSVGPTPKVCHKSHFLGKLNTFTDYRIYSSFSTLAFWPYSPAPKLGVAGGG